MRLWRHYFSTKGKDRDGERAVVFMEKACQQMDMASCTMMAGTYQFEYGVPRDIARANALYETSCTGGDAMGCGRLGINYMRGEGVEVDFARASVLLEKACDGGEVYFCVQLAKLYAVGKGVPRYVTMSDALYLKACEGKNMEGCNNYAWSQCHDQNVCTEDLMELSSRTLPQDTTGAYHDTYAYILCRLGRTDEGDAAYATACEINKKACGYSCAKLNEE